MGLGSVYLQSLWPGEEREWRQSGGGPSWPLHAIDSPCECEHNNPDSLDARLFPSVVLAVAPAVTGRSIFCRTILQLPIPILYVDWQHREVGGRQYIAQYWLYNTGGRAKNEVFNTKNRIDLYTLPEETN